MTVDDCVMTLDQAAARTGIPEDTLRRWIRRGLPHQFDTDGADARKYWVTLSAILDWCKQVVKDPEATGPRTRQQARGLPPELRPRGPGQFRAAANGR